MKRRRIQRTAGGRRTPGRSVRCILLSLILAAPAGAEHLAREDPPEPIFTQRAFIENDLE